MTAAAFERIANFRDAGGHPTRDGQRVRTGLLYRCGHLANATETDVDTLEQLGVGVVIDLRATVEREIEGVSRLPRGATLVHLPMGDVRAGEGIRELLSSGDTERIMQAFPPGAARDMMLSGARAFVVADEHRAAYSELVRTLIDADGTPALVHCSAGKDRTGWAVALVLLALGVAEPVVVADYLRSNESLGARMENLARTLGDRLDPSLLEPLVLVHEDYIFTSLAALEEEWGGIDGYLGAGLGIDEQLRSQLRSVFVEPGSGSR
jgi:protein-tyrosine phosphatase